MIRLGMKRLLIVFLVSLSLVWAGSEIAFQLIKEKDDRAPQTIELVIPQGTAAQVAQGNPIPSIPEEMVFVVGDTLLVKNEDVVDHQLGPLWVPAGSSASLLMEQADNLAYSCSFKSTRYLDLRVKEPTTFRTRLSALGLAVPATTMFLFVYSILIWPIQPRQKSSAAIFPPVQGNGV